MLTEELRRLIDEIGNVGNRPDLKEWRNKVLAEISRLEPHLYGHEDGGLFGCRECARDD